jgi:hypothetical protein
MTTPLETLTLRFELLSAATFGRGDGLPGLVDREVEHDRYGLPFLRGRTLRGLLAEEMENLLYALGVDRAQRQSGEKEKKWKEAGDRLLGIGGRMTDEIGVMRVGDAQLPEGVRRLIAVSLEERDSRLTPTDVLEAVTAIRRQTAMTPFGAPEPASLRAMRVVLPGTRFEAPLLFDQAPDTHERALLAATALAWRRAGTGRNRGRGRLRACIQDDEWMRTHLAIFEQEAQQ